MSATLPRRPAGLLMAAVAAAWLAGATSAGADECAALDGKLSQARQEMLDADNAIRNDSARLAELTPERARAGLEFWRTRERNDESQLRALREKISEPGDATPGVTPGMIPLHIRALEASIAEARSQVQQYEDIASGKRQAELNKRIADSTTRVQRAVLAQDGLRRDMESARCAAKARRPEGQAAVPRADSLPSPPPALARSASPPGQTAAAPTTELPPLPSAPASGDTSQPLAPPSQVATTGSGQGRRALPPLPSIDDLTIPPRPSTLTQPPIVEPPPPSIAGLPPLPPPPSEAGASASTDIIRAPVIRAPTVRAPAIVIPNVSAPPVHAPVVRAPPVVTPQVHAPPVHAPAVRAPPIHAARIQAPNIRGPRVGAATRDRRDTLLTPDRRPASTRVIPRWRPPVARPRVVRTPRPNPWSGLATWAGQRRIGTIGGR